MARVCVPLLKLLPRSHQSAVVEVVELRGLEVQAAPSSSSRRSMRSQQKRLQTFSLKVELLSLLQLLRLDGRFSSASCNKISIQASVFGSGVLSSLILSLFVFMVRYYLSIAMTAPALPAFCNSLFSEGGIDKVQSCLALTTHTRQHSCLYATMCHHVSPSS